MSAIGILKQLQYQNDGSQMYQLKPIFPHCTSQRLL